MLMVMNAGRTIIGTALLYNVFVDDDEATISALFSNIFDDEAIDSALFSNIFDDDDDDDDGIIDSALFSNILDDDDEAIGLNQLLHHHHLIYFKCF